jgi:type I restriction enzyme, S subunit
MIDGLKAYAEIRPAGLDWLEALPAEWKVLRAKNVFRGIDVRSETGTEELLTVSSNHGVVSRNQANVTMFKAESYVGHKLCWPRDLVVNSLWAWMQGLGFSHQHGLISSAYSVYRPREEFAGYAAYFHELLRSAAYRWELMTRSKGVWTSRLQLSDPAFFDMPIIVPPAEQAGAIIRFLAHTNRLIRRYIGAKRKLIKLFEEQKQAIIHRAVTRGLNPNVRLKPSGIEWLGDVPENWEIRRSQDARHAGRSRRKSPS